MAKPLNDAGLAMNGGKANGNGNGNGHYPGHAAPEPMTSLALNSQPAALLGENGGSANGKSTALTLSPIKEDIEAAEPKAASVSSETRCWNRIVDSSTLPMKTRVERSGSRASESSGSLHIGIRSNSVRIQEKISEFFRNSV